MLVVRGTKKLRDRLSAASPVTDEDATTALGDWFATTLFWRPQVALLVNARTLVPVFVSLAPTATLVDRIPTAVAAVLLRLGIDDAFVARELAEMSECRVAPTNNRSVVGSMNEFAQMGKWFRDECVDLVELSIRLAETPCGPLYGRHGSPDRELVALVESLTSDRRDTGERLAPVVPIASRQERPARNAVQLKATLVGIKPPIWRRVIVDSDTTLADLHEVLQAAFGWWDYHLHEFKITAMRYGVPPDDDDDWGEPTTNERGVRLSSVLRQGAAFVYVYDFGDYWRHKVVVEKVGPPDSSVTLPTCLDGRRACPPEDCGGTGGYENLLDALRDTTHPEHVEYREWAGQFNPEPYDPTHFDDKLRQLRLAKLDD